MDDIRTSPVQQHLFESPRSSPRRNVMATPGPDRLSTIMENNATAASKPANANRWSGFSKRSVPPRMSADQVPPPYAQWVLPENALRNPNEKTVAKKQNTVFYRRGGWGRLLLIILVLVILAIALAVGLGVGLTRHKTSTSASNSDSTPSSPVSTVFPMGEYSVVTALDIVQTNCTSNSATWRCYPYSTYSESTSESIAALNWVLSNTSSVYPTDSNAHATSSLGELANVTVSSTSNPFSITFSNQTVTYINNDTDPRYTFSFTQSKSVVPSTAITSDGSQSLCYFNSTTFTATLYLSDSSNSPSSVLNVSSATGGYTPWPYAVDVQQISPGGQNIPACYETTNGVVGQRITSGLTAEAADDECMCDYRNYDL